MKKLWIVVVLVGGLILALFLVPIFIPLSGINCQHQDINIKTGQARYSRCVWFMKISERMEETPLSRALNGEKVDVAEVKDWHRVNTFSPGVHHSPHYRFHGALAQVRKFEMLQEMYKLDPTNSAGIAKQLLVEWQTTGSDYAAGRFLNDKMIELELPAGGDRKSTPQP
jgi:hypothetical protein